jgi:dimethylamine/trimethylamine dehydrogenase
MNNELWDIRRRITELGVGTAFEQRVTRFSDGMVHLASVHRGGEARTIDCGSLLVVGVRARKDSLYQELASDPDRTTDAGISSVRSIGDCRAPGAIVHAVYSGHECARTIDAGDSVQTYNWERIKL